MKYKKRPLVVEAWRNPGDYEGIPAWVTAQSHRSPGGRIVIHTLEGQMVAFPGDWVIQGINGEVYPCKHEIFQKTYEKAE